SKVPAMIDLKLLRERPDEVLAIYRDRLFDEEAARCASRVLELDTQRRQVTQRADELKQRRNADSAAVGREKDPEKRRALIAQMDDHKGAIAKADEELGRLDEELRSLSLQLPNLPDPSVPTGRSDAENRVVRETGTRRDAAT